MGRKGERIRRERRKPEGDRGHRLCGVDVDMGLLAGGRSEAGQVFERAGLPAAKRRGHERHGW
jgi:hypothetical protein